MITLLEDEALFSPLAQKLKRQEIESLGLVVMPEYSGGTFYNQIQNRNNFTLLKKVVKSRCLFKA